MSDKKKDPRKLDFQPFCKQLILANPSLEQLNAMDMPDPAEFFQQCVLSFDVARIDHHNQNTFTIPITTDSDVLMLAFDDGVELFRTKMPGEDFAELNTNQRKEWILGHQFQLFRISAKVIPAVNVSISAMTESILDGLRATQYMFISEEGAFVHPSKVDEADMDMQGKACPICQQGIHPKQDGGIAIAIAKGKANPMLLIQHRDDCLFQKLIVRDTLIAKYDGGYQGTVDKEAENPLAFLYAEPTKH